MGSGNSKKEKVQEISKQGIDKILQDKKQEAVVSTEFPPFTENEIARLRLGFERLLDKGDQKVITLDRMRDMPQMRTHMFRERMYKIMENKLLEKQVQLIDFPTFVEILQVFHPQTSVDEKYQFIFQIYDFDEDEVIQVEDFKEVMKILYDNSKGKKKSKGAFMNNDDYLQALARDIMNDFDKDKSGAIDKDEFRELVDDLDLLFRLNINF